MFFSFQRGHGNITFDSKTVIAPSLSMDHSILYRLVNFWKKYFYLEPILILVLIFCLTLGLIYHRRERERIIFVVYFLTGVALFTIESPVVIILKLYSGRKSTVAAEMSNTLFEMIEFVAFYYFFKKCLKSKTPRKIIDAFLTTIAALVTIFFVALAFPSYDV